MAKRLVFVLVVVLLVLPATALAATVKVRVEGKTRTLFAPTELTVNATNAQDALEQASIIGEFYYHVTTSALGSYVDQIGRYGGSSTTGWVFKVDGKSPPVAANQVQLQDGDTVLWYYATFGPTGGPPTLAVKSATKPGCYTISALDDNGAPAKVTGVQLHVGSKRAIAAATGTNVCPGPHRGLLVRATATGAVRSNAVK
ncbi:MAG TPA: DUF4430 domain-containing protein [Gaiellaceae bacterium]